MATKSTPKEPKATQTPSTKGPVRKSASASTGPGARPRLRVSHGTAKGAEASQPSAARRSPKASAEEATESRSTVARASSAPGPRPARTARRTSAATTPGVQVAVAVAAAALDKKAANVEIIDLAGKADYTDYLVLMTGGSDRHVRAIADSIQEELDKKRVRPLSVEGTAGGNWILIDYGDVVAHVFQESSRTLYDLDGLWLDAARVPLPE